MSRQFFGQGDLRVVHGAPGHVSTAIAQIYAHLDFI